MGFLKDMFNDGYKGAKKAMGERITERAIRFVAKTIEDNFDAKTSNKLAKELGFKKKKKSTANVKAKKHTASY